MVEVSRRETAAAVAVLSVTAVGCGAQTDEARPGTAASSGPARAAGTVLDDARLVDSPAGAIVVSASGLYRANSRGLSRLGEPPTGARVGDVAFSDSANGVLAVLGDRDITVYSSVDGGAHWVPRSAKAVDSNLAPAGISSVRVAVAGSCIVIVAREATNTNFSQAVGLVSSNGGITWSTTRLPVAGEVAAASGVFWLVGGVQNQDVFSSGDGLTWAVTRPAGLGGDSAVGRITELEDGSVILPVTRTGSPGSISFARSADRGATWSAMSGTQIDSVREPGIAAPASLGRDGSWLVIETDGSRVYAGKLTADEPAVMSPNGLPPNVTGVVYRGKSDIVALASPSDCPAGKHSCASSTSVFGSTDGGQTWEGFTAS